MGKEMLVNLQLTANGSDFPGRRPEHFASRRHHTQLCQLEEIFCCRHISHILPSSDLEQKILVGQRPQSAARSYGRQPKPNYRLQPGDHMGHVDTDFPADMHVKTSDELPQGVD